MHGVLVPICSRLQASKFKHDTEVDRKGGDISGHEHSLKQMHIVDAALSMFDVQPAHPKGLARLFLR